MAQDVRSYFEGCRAYGKIAGPTGTKVARGGIADMETLCALVQKNPQKLLAIRNIGPKSLDVICSICEIYRRERATKIEHDEEEIS